MFLDTPGPGFIDDAVGVRNRHDVGLHTIMWECDYPHSDSTWPNAPESVMKYLGDLPDDEIDKITHLNAMKAFQYDPFEHIPREQCTVGALRAQATDVDLTLRSHGKGKFQEEGIVTALTLAEREEISRGLSAGHSLRQIAKVLQRSPSTP